MGYDGMYFDVSAWSPCRVASVSRGTWQRSVQRRTVCAVLGAAAGVCQEPACRGCMASRRLPWYPSGHASGPFSRVPLSPRLHASW